MPKLSISEESSVDPNSEQKPKGKKSKGNKKEAKLRPPNLTQLLSKRCIVLTRTAERVDRAFPEWLTMGFNEGGEYKPYDSNLPAAVLKRPEGRNAYIDDSPLTELGIKNSQELGALLSSSGIWPVDTIYVSPSFRSIQTASSIVRGAKDDSIKIRVEPALFDYMGWHEKIPQFLTPEFFAGVGQPIDLSYKPLKTVEQMQVFIKQESLEMFYNRIAKVVLRLSRATDDPAPKRILFVLHATCMDAAVKAFKNSSGEQVTESDFLHMGSYYPYSSTLTLAQDGDKWSYVHDPIPALPYRGITNHVNNRFIARTTLPRQK